MTEHDAPAEGDRLPRASDPTVALPISGGASALPDTTILDPHQAQLPGDADTGETVMKAGEEGAQRRPAASRGDSAVVSLAEVAASAAPTVPAEPAGQDDDEEDELPSGPAAIEVRGLVKRFASTGPPALKGIDLIVPRGEIYGFIGPNGAGKTTTLRILATLTPPTRGSARIAGFDVVTEPEQVRRRMGYLPDGAPAIPDFTVGEFLEFFAAAYGITGAQRKDVVGDVLSLVDLGDKRARPIAALSLGMRQRLGLARVLLHDPEVLLLDEPGTGLDPRARIEIREVLRELRHLGKTILISSHILGELNELCTSIGILEQGSVVFSGSLRSALARVRGGAYEVRVGGGIEAAYQAQAILEGLDAVESVQPVGEDDLLLVQPAPGATPGPAAKALVAAGLELLVLRPRAIDLEDAFLSLTEGKLA